jgi:alpha-N-arabinofuranosidase
VTWRNGWPVMTAPGQAIPYTHKRPALPAARTQPGRRNLLVREDFNGPALGHEWMMMRNVRDPWHRLSKGTLRLDARPVGLGDFGNPSFVGRRQQHMYATASTSVRFAPQPGDRAGLTAIQNDEYWYLLSVANEGGSPQVRLERRAGPDQPSGGTLIASRALTVPAGAPVQLRIRARGGAYDFEYATAPGRWQVLRSGEDGKILSTRTAGGFVGTVFGLYAFSPLRGERG